MSKRGQITIFIIIAVMVIVLIILFFVLRTGKEPAAGGKTEEENPNSFLTSCIEEKTKKTIELISMQGGYMENPLIKTFKFEDEKESYNISYLCYNLNLYQPCINQEPLLINHLKKEIKTYISDDVRGCFDRLTTSLSEKNYVVDARYKDFNITLISKKVVIDIDAELTLTKNEETSKIDRFKVAIPSRFYDLALVVQEIVSQEARFCNFEHLGFMLLYPKFNINKFRTGDSTTIYTVQHRDSQEKFRFAIRGCVIPPGI